MTLVQEVLARRRAGKPPNPEEARRIRRTAGVSQQRLAQELGVSRVTVSRWEAGARRPRGALASAYGRLLEEIEAAS